MDPTRFDAITRSLGEAHSRRTVLMTLGAVTLGAIGLAGTRSGASAAKGGNSACARFCAQVFGADTADADQCTRDAAHGTGLCSQCGPASDGSLKLCGTTCAACCADSDCSGGQICQSGTCVLNVDCATSATGTPCGPTTSTGAGTGACLAGTCFLVYPCASNGYGVVPNSGGVNACLCGYGTGNNCTTTDDCSSGYVCIGNGSYGYCRQGCPA